VLDDYLPRRVNTGPWATAYTLNELRGRPDAEFVLPICSLATPYADCAQLGDFVLPPLYYEALDDSLKSAILARITACFPLFGKDNSSRLRIVELPQVDPPTIPSAHVLAFSVDTAVEEHGPHLPLATDTIQSYSVLNQLATETREIEVWRPLEYGQLTWGLPFGSSIDLTADLLTPYVAGYVNALARWKHPQAIYVVDVHGSIAHRGAIVEGLKASNFSNWAFRWLHEPLAEFASERGDQHAGGVETALVERVSAQLLDPAWWPERIDEIAKGQMSFRKAVELTPDLDAFIRHVDEHSLNGVIGDITNYHALDADVLFERMMAVARRDVEQLLDGSATQSPGENLW
jgi:creatinine amidohydrolase/Fe(II)-dependent formamide hydrolase-like protein